MKREWDKITLLLTLCGIMSVVHGFNMLTNFSLLPFGIAPRNPYSLPFILSAPFLHGSVAHLINNIFGLLVFGSLCLLRSKQFFVRSSFFIVVVTGLMVWFFGRASIHIGASGWIFGLWSLCIAMAWVDRSLWSILVAIFVIIFYGGMLYGVLPGDPRVSYESHLFGALAGILCAFSLHRHGGRRRRSR